MPHFPSLQCSRWLFHVSSCCFRDFSAYFFQCIFSHRKRTLNLNLGLGSGMPVLIGDWDPECRFWLEIGIWNMGSDWRLGSRICVLIGDWDLEYGFWLKNQSWHLIWTGMQILCGKNSWNAGSFCTNGTSPRWNFLFSFHSARVQHLSCGTKMHNTDLALMTQMWCFADLIAAKGSSKLAANCLCLQTF